MLLVKKVLYLQCLDFFWVILVVLTPRFRHVIGVLVLVIHHLVTVTVNPVWPHLPAFLLLTGLVSISLPLTDLLCECSIDHNLLSFHLNPETLLAIFMPAHRVCCQAWFRFFVLLILLPHAIPVHGGWGVACIKHLHLHKLILVAIPKSMLEDMSVPCHSADHPVFQQNTALAEPLILG